VSVDQPVPGPTREQIRELVAELRRTADELDAVPASGHTSAVMGDAAYRIRTISSDLVALLPARPAHDDLLVRAEKLAGHLVGDERSRDAQTIQALVDEIEHLRDQSPPPTPATT